MTQAGYRVLWALVSLFWEGMVQVAPGTSSQMRNNVNPFTGVRLNGSCGQSSHWVLCELPLSLTVALCMGVVYIITETGT